MTKGAVQTERKSGSSEKRLALATPSSRNLPEAMCARAVA